MRVLVTGGGGFVGSHVVNCLESSGHDVTIYDRLAPPPDNGLHSHWTTGDITDSALLRRSLAGCDAAIHLAAVADVSAAADDPVEAYRTNVTGTDCVLRACERAGVERVIYASTVWVYGDVDAGTRVTEDFALPAPRDVYTATKLAGERLCQKQAGAATSGPTILRLGIPYGPRSRPSGVVAKFVDAALHGRPLEIAGNGHQSRPFVYVEDVAAGIVAALAPQAAGRTYNLCPDNAAVSVRELAEVVRTVVAPVPVRHTEPRPADVRGGPVCAHGAARDLNWRSTTPLPEGIRRYMRWLTATNGSPVAAHADRIDGSADAVRRQESGAL